MVVRFVKTHWHGHGFSVDARAYLTELPRLRGVLPPGAWAFASEPGHYDIPGAVSCVKDLELAGIRACYMRRVKRFTSLRTGVSRRTGPAHGPAGPGTRSRSRCRPG